MSAQRGTKLKAAGRRVTLMVPSEMPLGYYFFAKLLPEGEAAFAAIRTFLEGIGVKAW